VVARLADRVIVMYAGRIVEQAAVRAFYTAPRHPYSQGLLASLPRSDDDPTQRLQPIPGQPSDLTRARPGCDFAPRCRFATERCLAEAPPLESSGEDARASVACWRAGEIGVGHVH
jgi:oligopeptide transport system ATP-binding protein